MPTARPDHLGSLDGSTRPSAGEGTVATLLAQAGCAVPSILWPEGRFGGSGAVATCQLIGWCAVSTLVGLGMLVAPAEAVSGAVSSPQAVREAERHVGRPAMPDPLVRSLLSRVMVRDGRGREVFGGRPTVRSRSSSRMRLSLRGTRAASEARLSVDVDAASPGVTAVTIRPPAQVGARRVGLRLPIGRSERFYGWGERFGRLDLRGQVVENWVEDRRIDPRRRTSHSPMPLLLSSRSYGVLLDTNARASIDVGSSTPGQVRIRVHTGVLRLWILHGPTLKVVLGRAAGLVGRPPLVPRWGLGVWKALIGGERRALADLRRLRRHGVPLDAAWVYDLTEEHSGVGWPWPIYRSIPSRPYQDPRRFVRTLHGHGLKVLGYLNPFVVKGRPSFEVARERGLLVTDDAGRASLFDWRVTRGRRVRTGTVDLTRKMGRRWLGQRVRYAVGELGLDGAMQDFGEGLPAGGQARGALRTALAHNRYPVHYTATVRDAAESVKPYETVFFARAGYLGTQRSTTGRFTGDQERSWDRDRGLASALRAMLSGSLSGWPYWGPDIGGFTSTPTSVEDETELWTRWVQLGALSPTMRDMLGDQRRGTIDALTNDETLRVFRAYARIHQALKSYLHRTARVAVRTGVPIVRPLFLEYPDDRAAAATDDQYLLGRDVLVAPVLKPDVVRRAVYLPAGTWVDYWTGRRLRGGRRLVVNAPQRVVPLFIRAGAQVALPSPRRIWSAP